MLAWISVMSVGLMSVVLGGGVGGWLGSFGNKWGSSVWIWCSLASWGGPLRILRAWVGSLSWRCFRIWAISCLCCCSGLVWRGCLLVSGVWSLLRRWLNWAWYSCWIRRRIVLVWVAWPCFFLPARCLWVLERIIRGAASRSFQPLLASVVLGVVVV